MSPVQIPPSIANTFSHLVDSPNEQHTPVSPLVKIKSDHLLKAWFWNGCATRLCEKIVREVMLPRRGVLSCYRITTPETMLKVSVLAGVSRTLSWVLLPRRGTSLLLSFNDFENKLCGFSFG
ncbi:14872_t:CDS:2, partial [Funneliformis mosseae]